MKTNKISIAVFVLLLTFYFISTGWAATYYVSTNGIDSNSGTTVDEPFKTIQIAVDRAVAGDSILIAPGIYNEGRVITKNSGTNNNYITISGSKSAIINRGFQINHSYIKINNLTVRDNGLMGDFVFRFQGANNIEVSDNIIECVVPDIDRVGQSGIRVWDDSSYITIKDNIIQKFDGYTIYLQGHHNLVDNNIIIGDGFPLPDGDNDVFLVFGHDQTISNNDVSGYLEGNKHLDMIQSWGEVYNIIINSNYFHDTEGTICMLENPSGAAGNFIFKNNIYSNVEKPATIGFPNVFFYNNTFYKTSGTTVLQYRYEPTTEQASGGIIKNNLFIDCSDNLSLGWYSQTGSPPVPLVHDYNYVTHGDDFSEKTGFSETHGINGGNPKFVDLANNDFRLQSDSPAKNSGTTLTGFSVDKNGIIRPQGSAWDIGAYEFPLGNNNAKSTMFGITGGADITGGNTCFAQIN